jgi:hypothetical protein
MTWQISLLRILPKQLEELCTDPNLQESILHCIYSALTGHIIQMTGPYSTALAAQAHIGWLAMLRGYWTLEWQLAYESTYQSPDSKKWRDKLKRLQQMTRWQKQSRPNDVAHPDSTMEAQK